MEKLSRSRAGLGLGIEIKFLIVIIILIVIGKGIILLFKYIGQYFNIITIATYTRIKTVSLIKIITKTSIIILR
jgi:hypothetical protein